MTGPALHIYEFGDFRIEATKHLLLRKGEPVSLTPKVFETLLYLVRHQGDLVKKDDLVRAVWPDTVVEENNLNQNISTLRRVLGENRGENRYIVTVPGRGYRLAYEERDVRLTFLRTDPKWDSLRSDSRFVDLVRRIGLA